MVSLACDKAKEHGYPHELWTTTAFGPPCARARTGGGSPMSFAHVWLKAQCASFSVKEEIKPHKVRSYLERRDAEFEPKMAEVRMCVYREVQVLEKAAAKAEKSWKKPVAIVSYDDEAWNPGHRHDGTGFPPPVPGRHASFAAGSMSTNAMATLSLFWPGSICSPGQGPRRSIREQPPQPRVHRIPQAPRCRLSGSSTAIKLILDNHSAHISKETRAWRFDTRPPGRFDFTFTPKHGSWLNLIEGFFSKLRPLSSDAKCNTPADLISAG